MSWSDGSMTPRLASQVEARARVPGAVYAADHGVVADGVTDDATALNAAITEAAAGVAGGQGNTVLLPAGVVMVGAQIAVKNKVRLVGTGKRSTGITAMSGTFPSSTPIVRLGDGASGIIFDCRLEHLFVDAAVITGSTSVYSNEANEGSGVFNCLLGNYRTNGLHFDSGCSIVGGANLEIFAGAGGSNAGILLDTVAGNSYIDGATIVGDASGTHTDAVNVTACQAILKDIHCERYTDGIDSSNGVGTIINACGSGTGLTNLIHLGAGTKDWTVIGANRNGATHTLVDDFAGLTLDDSFIRYYAQGPMYLPGGTQIINNRGSIPSTSGTLKGTICWNNNPSTGNPVGWICTVSGSPDTWKGFGNVL